MLEKEVVGKKLKAIAEENNWSISQLAEYFGKKPNSFQQYINGKLYPTPEMIARLLEDFDPTYIDWLLNGTLVKGDEGNGVVREPNLKYRGKNTFSHNGVEYPLIAAEVKKLLDSIMARLAIAERQKLEAESETLKILKDNVRLDKRCRELEAENQSLKNQQLQKDVIKKN